MLLGRVIGTVVPAALAEELSATPLLWVQPLDRQGQADGKPLVCADGTRTVPKRWSRCAILAIR